VILRVRLTKGQKDSLIADEADAHDHKLRLEALKEAVDYFNTASSRRSYERHSQITQTTQYRLVGSIPPWQIDVYENDKWRQLARKLSKALGEHVFYIVAPIVSSLLHKASGDDLLTDISIDLSFDPRDEQAANLIERSRFEFLSDFTAKQKRALRAALAEAQREGLGTAETARMIRDSIGLTETQWRAVQNYRNLLEGGSSQSLNRVLRDRRFDSTVQSAINRGDILTDEQIDRMVDRYTSRMLDYRAENIARTESHAAASAARHMAWKQMTDQLGVGDEDVIRTWNDTHDKRTRHTHRAMGGQTVVGFQPYQSPSGATLRYPGDPQAPAEERINCRCVETYGFAEAA
jgi:hypothetical protein